MFLAIFFTVAAGCWLGISLGALFHLRWARRLPALAVLTGPHELRPGGEVRCSVVIAARDEAARIGATVRCLLAQSGVAVEVIVVDDRSTDGTGEILRLSSGQSFSHSPFLSGGRLRVGFGFQLSSALTAAVSRPR